MYTMNRVLADIVTTVMADIVTKKDKIKKRKETKRVLVKIAAYAGWCYYSYALPCKFLVLTLAPVKK